MISFLLVSSLISSNSMVEGQTSYLHTHCGGVVIQNDLSFCRVCHDLAFFNYSNFLFASGSVMVLVAKLEFTNSACHGTSF